LVALQEVCPKGNMVTCVEKPRKEREKTTMRDEIREEIVKEVEELTKTTS